MTSYAVVFVFIELCAAISVKEKFHDPCAFNEDAQKLVKWPRSGFQGTPIFVICPEGAKFLKIGNTGEQKSCPPQVDKTHYFYVVLHIPLDQAWGIAAIRDHVGTKRGCVHVLPSPSFSPILPKTGPGQTGFLQIFPNIESEMRSVLLQRAETHFYHQPCRINSLNNQIVSCETYDSYNHCPKPHVFLFWVPVALLLLCCIPLALVATWLMMMMFKFDNFYIPVLAGKATFVPANRCQDFLLSFEDYCSRMCFHTYHGLYPAVKTKPHSPTKVSAELQHLETLSHSGNFLRLLTGAVDTSPLPVPERKELAALLVLSNRGNLEHFSCHVAELLIEKITQLQFCLAHELDELAKCPPFCILLASALYIVTSYNDLRKNPAIASFFALYEALDDIVHNGYQDVQTGVSEYAVARSKVPYVQQWCKATKTKHGGDVPLISADTLPNVRYTIAHNTSFNRKTKKQMKDMKSKDVTLTVGQTKLKLSPLRDPLTETIGHLGLARAGVVLTIDGHLDSKTTDTPKNLLEQDSLDIEFTLEDERTIKTRLYLAPHLSQLYKSIEEDNSKPKVFIHGVISRACQNLGARDYLKDLFIDQCILTGFWSLVFFDPRRMLDVSPESSTLANMRCLAKLFQCPLPHNSLHVKRLFGFIHRPLPHGEPVGDMPRPRLLAERVKDKVNRPALLEDLLFRLHFLKANIIQALSELSPTDPRVQGLESLIDLFPPAKK